MDKKMYQACIRALKAFNMSEYLSKAQIANAIEPYTAVDAVIDELKQKGFIVGFGFEGYKITPLGRESDDWYMDQLKDKEWDIAQRKRIKLQFWINTILSTIAIIISIIALCLKIS